MITMMIMMNFTFSHIVGFVFAVSIKLTHSLTHSLQIPVTRARKADRDRDNMTIKMIMIERLVF
jgi:hypothetical protein